jgi:uncharacterized protein YjbI with pentapeptide repeats
MSDSDKKRAPPRVDWRGANLSGGNMAGMNLEYGDFRGCNLRNVNFTGSILRYGDFRGAEMQGANFQNAILYGARMQGVEAYQADFRGADLRQANLGGAYLEGAMLPEPAAAKPEQPGREGAGASESSREVDVSREEKSSVPERNKGRGKDRSRRR